jgi:hypothetical protein
MTVDEIYGCVERQTPNSEGVEYQAIISDYSYSIPSEL